MENYRRKKFKILLKKELFILNKKTIKISHYSTSYSQKNFNDYDHFFSLNEDKYNEVLEGDLIYMNIVNILTETTQFALYPVQLWGLKLAILCVLPKIYQRDWETRNKEILKKHGITNIYQIYCLTAPRRSGKTVMLSMLNLSLLLSIKSVLNDLFIIRSVAKFLSQSNVFFFFF